MLLFVVGLLAGLRRRRPPPQCAATTAGRGHDHISAQLEEGDLVLYQAGSWLVDNVLVGNEPARLEVAEVSLVQLVFTHNCEHGWIYGYPRSVAQDGAVLLPPGEDSEEVQIGPEQLIAILSTTSTDSSTRILDDGSRRLLPDNDCGGVCSSSSIPYERDTTSS